MDLITLLIAAAITVGLVWLIQSGRVSPPFHWLLWAVLIIVWLIVLLRVLGLNLHTATVG